jgi:hypothetical protein
MANGVDVIDVDVAQPIVIFRRRTIAKSASFGGCVVPTWRIREQTVQVLLVGNHVI